MVIQERYSPLKVAANGTVTIAGNNIGGFLAITAGTVDVKKADGTSIFPAVLTVTANVYYPIPAFLGNEGGSVVCAGGASGTVFV